MSKKQKLIFYLDSDILDKYIDKQIKKYENSILYYFFKESKLLNYDLRNLIYCRIFYIKITQEKVFNLWLEDNSLIKCENCGNIWDGNAQCNCW